jgi:hypothetical protein
LPPRDFKFPQKSTLRGSPEGGGGGDYCLEVQPVAGLLGLAPTGVAGHQVGVHVLQLFSKSVDFVLELGSKDTHEHLGTQKDNKVTPN